jgi:L-rhamnose mutarotase
MQDVSSTPHLTGVLVPTVALHTKLKPGKELEYDAAHQVIPPALARALTEHGVRDWQIWRDGRDVFHLVDVEDYQAMRAGLRDLPANLEWQASLAPLFDQPDNYDGGDGGIGHVWCLGEQLRNGENRWH